MIKTLNPNQIVVNERKISHSSKDINEMIESITLNGLINPIIVDKNNVLVSGLCRLEATKLLKSETIECKVVSGAEDELSLIQIDENLVRKTLSSFEKMELLFEKTEIMKSMKIKSSTETISEENNISLRKLQKDNKMMKSINSVPNLFNMISSMNNEDNLSRDEVERTSNSKNVQTKILNNEINSTSELREELVKELNISFGSYDMEEILGFFNSKVEEMNNVIKKSDEEKLKIILTQIQSFSNKKLNPVSKIEGK